MGPFVPIDDPLDPRLADYVGLTDADLRGRVEVADRCFIAEGVLAVRALLGSGCRVRSVLGTAVRLDAIGPELAECDAPVFVVSSSVLDHTAGFRVHRGLLASGERPADADASEVLHPARLVVVIEGVNDHENMGSLFRNAAAFGVDAILLSPGCCDPLYRRSVRVSLGHVLGVPFAVLPRWPAELATTVKTAGFTLLGLTPAAGAVPVDHVGVASGSKIAVMVGAEGPGLTAGALAACDERVRITLAPGVDSLNVATAAAIALHRLAPLSRPSGD